MNFQEYMVELVTKKPKQLRWGQWAMNLLYKDKDAPYYVSPPIEPGGPWDVWEINDMSNPKFGEFLLYIQPYFK